MSKVKNINPRRISLGLTTQNLKVLKKITHAIFLTFSVLYVELLIIEYLKAGVVSNYIDLNIFLVILIGLWVLDIVFKRKLYGDIKADTQEESVHKNKFTIPILLAILSIIILSIKLRGLGATGFVSSFVGGITIGLITYHLRKINH